MEIIDTDKYFVELTDESRGTIGYTVVFPENLLKDIIKQNKQLAHQNQEYENLKEDYKELEQRHNGAFQDFKRLKQECEELKEKYEEVKEDRYNLNMEMYVLDRYHKTLKEIEEVWEKDKDGDYDFVKRQIFNIISKAKGGTND